ncbi:MAG: hypothetical protein HY812_06405 [Planctomycetes bacterium]|nr:hypothetical protein [Planctomycetota bacterium]
MHPGWSWREGAAVLLLAALGASLLLREPLFQGRSTLAFSIDDPRIDIRPWARPLQGAPPLINPITPDIDGFVLPGLMRARQLEERGDGPWWDPGQLLGYPLAANMPFPLFSPVRWLLEPFCAVTALDLALWLHLVAAAVLAYRLCRMLGARPAAAALGAVGFALSGWMYTHWHLPQILYTSCFWPGQLAALEWLRRGRLRRAFLEGALFTALIWLAGFPQVGVILTAGAVFLALLDRELRSVRRLATLLAALSCGVLLSAPQTAITLDAYRGSLRARQEAQAATARRGLPPAALIGALLPEFFGRPSDFAEPEPPADTMEDWLPQRRFLGEPLQNNVVENALYPGTVILLLVPLILRRAVDRRARLLLLLASLCLGAALAAPYLVPLWSGFERLAAGNVKRVLALVAGALPIAAALAYDALAERRVAAPKVFAVVLVALLALLPWLAVLQSDLQADLFARSLAGQAVRQALFLLAALGALLLSARWVRFLPAVVLAADLALLAWAFNPFPEQREPFPPTRTTTALAARAGRVVVFGTGPNLLPATAATLFDIRSLQGMVPMVSARVADLLACVEDGLFDRRDPRVAAPLSRRESLGHPLLDLLGVDTVVHADPGLPAASGLPELFAHADESVGALARPQALPRAFFCGGARVVLDRSERLALLAAGAFDMRRSVLLEVPPRASLPVEGETIPLAAEQRAATYHGFAVEAPAPGLVVLTEGYDPG